MATDPDTFELLPLSIDPQTKAVSLASQQQDSKLADELATLNTTHRAFQTLDPPSLLAPPPPTPVKPQRTHNINRLRESALTALKRQQQSSSDTIVPANQNDAIRFFTLAVEMATQRPGWEPAGLLREELSSLYNQRANAYLTSARSPADALIDAKLSLECKKSSNPAAWVRGTRALKEMGRLVEAREWAEQGIDVEDGAVKGARADVRNMEGKGAPEQMRKQVRDGVAAMERDLDELKGLKNELDAGR